MLENEVTKIDNMIMRVVEQRMMMEGQQNQLDTVSMMHKAALESKQNMKVCGIIMCLGMIINHVGV